MLPFTRIRKLAAGLLVSLSAGSLSAAVDAATIGSFDATRVDFRGGAASLITTAPYFSAVRRIFADNGHVLATPTGSINADYLSTLSHMIVGPMPVDFMGGALSGIEQTTLASWVESGGVALVIGENATFTANTNSALQPFGISLSNNIITLFGGSWTPPEGPLSGLTEGISENDALLYFSSNYFAPGDYETLATIEDLSGEQWPALIAFRYGAGLVVATGDANFLDDGRINDAGKAFIKNVMMATPVPLPASLPLIATALGILAMRRRNRHR